MRWVERIRGTRKDAERQDKGKQNWCACVCTHTHVHKDGAERRKEGDTGRQIFMTMTTFCKARDNSSQINE